MGGIKRFSDQVKAVAWMASVNLPMFGRKNLGRLRVHLSAIITSKREMSVGLAVQFLDGPVFVCESSDCGRGVDANRMSIGQ